MLWSQHVARSSPSSRGEEDPWCHQPQAPCGSLGRVQAAGAAASHGDVVTACSEPLVQGLNTGTARPGHPSTLRAQVPDPVPLTKTTPTSLCRHLPTFGSCASPGAASGCVRWHWGSPSWSHRASNRGAGWHGGTPIPAPPHAALSPGCLASKRHGGKGPSAAPGPHRCPQPCSRRTPLAPSTKSSPPTPPAQLQFLTAPSFLSHSSRPLAQKPGRERNKE